jgi:hypothetical protein
VRPCLLNAILRWVSRNAQALGPFCGPDHTWKANRSCRVNPLECTHILHLLVSEPIIPWNQILFSMVSVRNHARKMFLRCFQVLFSLVLIKLQLVRWTEEAGWHLPWISRVCILPFAQLFLVQENARINSCKSVSSHGMNIFTLHYVRWLWECEACFKKSVLL